MTDLLALPHRAGVSEALSLGTVAGTDTEGNVTCVHFMFADGQTISVLRDRISYGGKEGLFEVTHWWPGEQTQQPTGWLSEEGVVPEIARRRGIPTTDEPALRLAQREAKALTALVDEVLG